MPDSREKASMLTNLPPPRTKSGDRILFLPRLALVVSVLVMSTAILLHEGLYYTETGDLKVRPMVSDNAR